jgi:hypothetical protein
MCLAAELLAGANHGYKEATIIAIECLNLNCPPCYVFLDFFYNYFDSFFLKLQRNFSFS